MSSEHSLFSASAAHRWVRCPGSIALTENTETFDSDSAAAAEGTMLHEALNWCLEQDHPPNDWSETHEFLTDEQEDAVLYCIEYIRALPQTGMLMYEYETNYADEIGQARKEAFGTLDASILDGTTLHVLDAKFGRRHVDAFENYQMLLYAIGMVGALQALGEEIDEIVLHIMQPRTTGSNEPWSLTIDELHEWAQQFKNAAERVQFARESFDIDSREWRAAYLFPSPEACQWCPVKATCPMLREIADDAADLARSADVSEFDEDTLASALHMLPLLEQFTKAVHEEGLARLGAGKAIPGYKLITGRAGNRKWKDEDAVGKFLIEHGIDNPNQPPKVMTPTQAQNALAKVLKEANGGTKKDAKLAAGELLESQITKNPPKPSLVTEDTAGKPWQTGASLEEFE